MWVAVGLILIVMGVQADKVLLDQYLQVSLVVQVLLSREADFVAADPRIGKSTWNSNYDIPFGKRRYKRAAVDLLKCVCEVVFRQTSKSHCLVDRSKPSESFNFSSAQTESD